MEWLRAGRVSVPVDYYASRVVIMGHGVGIMVWL